MGHRKTHSLSTVYLQRLNKLQHGSTSGSSTHSESQREPETRGDDHTKSTERDGTTDTPIRAVLSVRT